MFASAALALRLSTLQRGAGGGRGGGSSVAKATLWYGHLSKELLRLALKMSLRDCATGASRLAKFDSLKPRGLAEHTNGG